MRNRAWDSIDGLGGKLWGLAQRIHANLEQGFAEYQAAAWLTAELQKSGFQVDRRVAGLPIAFRAELP